MHPNPSSSLLFGGFSPVHSEDPTTSAVELSCGPAAPLPGGWELGQQRLAALFTRIQATQTEPSSGTTQPEQQGRQRESGPAGQGPGSVELVGEVGGLCILHSIPGPRIKAKPVPSFGNIYLNQWSPSHQAEGLEEQQ